MNRKFSKRPVKFAVVPEGMQVFDEHVTSIEIIDESAGEFVEISQCVAAHGEQKIQLDDDEWLVVRSAIDDAFAEIKKNAKKAAKT